MNSDQNPTPAKRPVGKRLLRAALKLALSLLLFLLALEIALRLTGFKHHRYIQRVQDNQSIAVLAEFNEDPYLLWAPKPGLPPFNDQGYIGPELPRERTPGTIRIACLGDSCTQVGSPPYPELVERLLKDRGHENVEVMNWGVAGYSSFQGLTRLQRQVLAFQPDIVTVYFGWNDHWINAGIMDDLAAHRASRRGPIRQTLEQTRTAQALALIAESTGRHFSRAQFRVPLPAYRENIRQMIRLTREHGSHVLLITAPGCLIDDRPIARNLEGLASLGYTTAAAVHADYIQATRSVATETNTELFDAARYFAEDISGCDYFLADRDPVHFTQLGMEILAEQLAGELIRSGLLR